MAKKKGVKVPRPKKPSMKSGPMQEMPNPGALKLAMQDIDNMKKNMKGGNNKPAQKAEKFMKKKV